MLDGAAGYSKGQVRVGPILAFAKKEKRADFFYDLLEMGHAFDVHESLLDVSARP